MVFIFKTTIHGVFYFFSDPFLSGVFLQPSPPSGVFNVQRQCEQKACTHWAADGCGGSYLNSARGGSLCPPLESH